MGLLAYPLNSKGILQPFVFVMVEGFPKYEFLAILDTGSEFTFFPSSYASLIGHDNLNSKVRKVRNIVGFGHGLSEAFIHTVDMKFIGMAEEGQCWNTGNIKVGFTDALDKKDFCFVVIGLDIIRKWDSLKFHMPQDNNDWQIQIETP